MSMFSRQHYIAIAAVLFDWPKDSPEQRLIHTQHAESLAQLFLSDNPRFDRQKFLEASGVHEE